MDIFFALCTVFLSEIQELNKFNLYTIPYCPNLPLAFPLSKLRIRVYVIMLQISGLHQSCAKLDHLKLDSGVLHFNSLSRSFLEAWMSENHTSML